MLLANLGFSLSLLARPVYRSVALVQGLLYGLGTASALGYRPALVPGWIIQPVRQFTVGNYATAAGVIRGLRRRQAVTWKSVR
jgi:hypothetical protein